MYIAQLERQLIQQMLNQFRKVRAHGEYDSFQNHKINKNFHKKDRDRSQSTNLLRSSFVKNIGPNQSSPKALSSHSTNLIRDVTDLRKSSLTPQEEV